MTEHEHSWVPMRLVSFDPPEQTMLQGCVCGAYRWVKAHEVKTA